MSFANVNVGTSNSDNTGDSLRAAFQKINQNFAEIESGNVSITVDSPVTSVAGKTGDVVIYASDINGLTVSAVTEAASQSSVATAEERAFSRARSYTDTKVSQAVSNLLDSAPGALNTLNELASALGEDPNFATTITNRLGDIETELASVRTESGASVSQAITNLQTNIDDEATARVSADTTLQNNIDALSGDLTAAISSAIGTFNSNINDEADTRAAADTALQDNIDTEAQARVAADDALSARIDSVVSNIDPAALDSLTEIVGAFQAADANLNNAITALAGTAGSGLQDEIDRATAAEQTLQDNIDAEATARQTRDSELETGIDAVAADLVTEQTARANADTTLQDNIDAEATARQTRDSELETSINDVSTALSTEITDRINDVTDLQNQITSILNNVDPAAIDSFTEVVTAFQNADDSLSGTITNLQTSLTDDIAAVQANVNTLSSSLANVATSGSYTDLSDKPTIPGVGNFILSGNTIRTSNGDSGIDLYINGADSNEALIERKWRFASDGSIQFVDPFLSSPTAFITTTKVGNWDTAYSWGDHSTAGYLTAYTETDPVVGAITGIVKSDGAGNITAAVAGTDYSTFDGAYSSLTGAPTAVSDFTNDAGYLTAGDIAVDTGDFTFSSNTLGVSNGEIVLVDNVGIQNDNPGYMLHVGKKTDISQTGSIGIAYGDVDTVAGTVTDSGMTMHSMGGEVSLTWDWSDGQGNGSNPDSNHARFGIFKNGSFTQPWLTFDRDAPAGVLEVDGQGRLIVTNGSGINTTASGTSYSDTNFKIFDPWGALFVTNRDMASNGSGTTSITDVSHSFFTEANVTENLSRYDRIRGFSSSLDVMMNGYQWDAWNKFPTVAGATMSIKAIGSGTISQSIGNASYSIINATDGSLNVADTTDAQFEDYDLGASVGVLGGAQLIVTDPTGNASTVDVAAGLSAAIYVDATATGAGVATVTNAVGLYLPWRANASNSWARTNGSNAVITNRYSILSEDPTAVLRNYGDIETNGSIKFVNGSVSFKMVSVPASSLGQSGDYQGMVAYDSNYHYYCTSSYDGSTNIWKRVAWGSDTW